MKIFITIGSQPLNGYINIDPSGGDGKKSMDFRSLDDISEPAQCTEICAPEILDYIHHSEIMPVLQNWVSKLRHGGTIIVGGTDCYEVAKGIVSCQLDTVVFNKALFGLSPQFPFIKLGMYTRHDIESILRNFGLKIIHKRINNRTYTVEAKRD